MKDDIAFAAVIFTILAGSIVALALSRFDSSDRDLFDVISPWSVSHARAATTCPEPAASSVRNGHDPR